MKGEEGHGFCKEYFLPEESFQSWGKYGRALKQTGSRLKDRMLTRSLAEIELKEVCARSEHAMKKTLNWWDLIWIGIGAVMGSAIFVLTGLEAKTHAGPAVVLSFVISGISAMLSVFCYTEFAIEIPVAGGSFAYLKVELGDFVAFIGAGNILLEYVIGGAAVARTGTSYFATLCNHAPGDFRIHTNLAAGYNELDPVAVGILILTCILATVSTKATSKVNYIASVLHIGVIIFVIIAGLSKADTKNYTDFMPFGVRGIFTASSVLFFAYLGFDMVATLAEETKNPAKDVPIGLVGSMLVVIVCYCLMAVTLCLMQNYKDIDEDAPYSVAFERVGMNWAKYIVALGALKGMTTVLMMGVVGQARYLTHIARTHLVPPWFGLVHEKTGTPVNATIVMVVATAIIVFFTELEILANLLSISTLFIFSLVALGLIVRRYYVSGVTSRSDQYKMVGFVTVIIASSTATAVYWAHSDGWLVYCVTVPILFLGTLGLHVFVPQARSPKTWGVPLVPWVPALSIAVNCFLLGSIDNASFVRFAGWTGVILVYYIFFGLHASYDTAKAADAQRELKGAEQEFGHGTRLGNEAA